MAQNQFNMYGSLTLRIGCGVDFERVLCAGDEAVHVPPGRGLPVRPGEHRLELDLDEVVFDRLQN